MRWLAGLLLAFASLTLLAQDKKDDKSGGIVVDKEKRAVIIDCKIAPRKIDDEKFKGQIYPIEVVASWPYPKGQKAHETVLSFDVKPSDVHKALETLGLKAGTPAFGDVKDPGTGPAVNIFLQITGADGEPRKVPMEKCLVDPKTNKPMPKVEWRFTGSAMVQPDPTKPEKVYGADQTGTLISIFPVTNQTVFQTSLTMKEEKYIKLEVNKELLPKEGTAVKLILEVPGK